jgi:chaperonin GroES
VNLTDEQMREAARVAEASAIRGYQAAQAAIDQQKKAIPMPTIRPILDRLIVRRDPTKDVTRGVIIIPDTAKELSLEGTVIAVGPGKPLDNGRVREPQVRTGERVLFSKHSGWSFKRRDETDDGECFVLEERDVLAVIDP